MRVDRPGPSSRPEIDRRFPWARPEAAIEVRATTGALGETGERWVRRRDGIPVDLRGIMEKFSVPDKDTSSAIHDRGVTSVHLTNSVIPNRIKNSHSAKIPRIGPSNTMFLDDLVAVRSCFDDTV
jgi:hypothetical protein